MLPDEYPEERRVWLLTGEMQLVLFEPSKPRHVPLDRVRLPLRELGWSEPVPTRIASATIHSRCMDRCAGL
jgi:hypothetical protein